MIIVNQIHTKKIIDLFSLKLQDVTFCVLNENLIRDHNGQNKVTFKNILQVEALIFSNIGKDVDLSRHYSILLTEVDIFNLILKHKEYTLKTLHETTQGDMSLSTLLPILYS